MAVFLSQRWCQQPQGPVQINWSNPLTRGLIAAVTDQTEVVNQKKIGFDSRVTRQGGLRGIGWYRETLLDSGTSLASSIGVKIPLGSTHTVGVLAQSNAAGAAGANFQYRYLASWTRSTRFYWYPAQNQFTMMYWDGSIVGQYAVGNADYKGRFGRGTTAAGVWDGATARLYIDGRQQGTTPLTAVATDYNEDILIGGNSNNTDWHWMGWIPCLAAWSRPLSASELFEWNSNPWQLFRPQKPILYSLPAITGTYSRYIRPQADISVGGWTKVE